MFKTAVAFALSVVTAISSYGLSKMEVRGNESKDSISYTDEMINPIENSGLLEKNLIYDKIYENNLSSDNTCDNEIELTEKVEVDESIIEDKEEIEIFDSLSNLDLGDNVIITDGAKIYSSVSDAVDMINGFNSYYANDVERTLKCIALEYDDEIIYSESIEEVKFLKSEGAVIVSVGTSINDGYEGFYNANDVVVKTKTR